ncbi:MAG: hypothetical protein FWD57_17280, partial [Polyangiaceae bacterium]|nr:hypothetical protein [Polyangiaceae bacterium]
DGYTWPGHFTTPINGEHYNARQDEYCFQQLANAAEHLRDCTSQNETNIAGIDQRVIKNVLDIKNINIRVSQNETDIQGIDQRVSQNTSDIQSIDQRVSQNTGDISNLNSRLIAPMLLQSNDPSYFSNVNDPTNEWSGLHSIDIPAIEVGENVLFSGYFAIGPLNHSNPQSLVQDVVIKYALHLNRMYESELINFPPATIPINQTTFIPFTAFFQPRTRDITSVAISVNINEPVQGDSTICQITIFKPATIHIPR